MGRAHRRNTPQRAVKRAKEQEYRDRRRRAEAERAEYRELAEQMRPLEMPDVELVAELLVRAAADGDESALRILTWREHLNALGVVFPEDIDERTWAAVKATHDGRTPRVTDVAA